MGNQCTYTTKSSTTRIADDLVLVETRFGHYFSSLFLSD